MKPFNINKLLANLPKKPGVYQMLDEKSQIIYVGKAKDLKKRVSSYFSKTNLSPKTQALVGKVCDIQFILTENETDALLLEAELIKKENPRYNILLRDDKSYPFIAISNRDDYPRIMFYRGNKSKKYKFFGPYTNVHAVKETIDFLQKLFKTRTCKDGYFNNRTRPCLEYQIGRCTAPCVNKISKEHYQFNISMAIKFLSGKSDEVIKLLTDEMTKASQAHEFEKAAPLRDQIQKLRTIQKARTLSHEGGNADVLGLAAVDNEACIYLMVIRSGQLLRTQSHFLALPTIDSSVSDEIKKEIFNVFIKQHYLLNKQLIPRELICAFEIDADIKQAMISRDNQKCVITFKPKLIKRKWLNTANENANTALDAHIKQKCSWKINLACLAESLTNKEQVSRVECFDISHTGGESTKASCVVFDRGGANKRAYRQFDINGVVQGDDYAAIAQAVLRRFKRLKKESKSVPDILFIDGGKGQLNAAHKALLELNVSNVVLVAIAKGPTRRAGFETIFTIGEDDNIVSLSLEDEVLSIIQQVRDEAHRFAVSSHRKKRDKKVLVSILEEIPGVGQKKRAEILNYFGGMIQVKAARIEELMNVRGISFELAKKIHQHLRERY